MTSKIVLLQLKDEKNPQMKYTVKYLYKNLNNLNIALPETQHL